MSESVSAQFSFIINRKKNTNNVSSSSTLKYGHSQTGSYIFATDHMSLLANNKSQAFIALASSFTVQAKNNIF